MDHSFGSKQTKDDGTRDKAWTYEFSASSPEEKEHHRSNREETLASKEEGSRRETASGFRPGDPFSSSRSEEMDLVGDAVCQRVDHQLELREREAARDRGQGIVAWQYERGMSGAEASDAK
uniref:Uncharacterized protein n=1 Tax=Kwoniella bestiolae CBS 10118 TaxID=1296100 RepID=A0A1B9FUG7_9TREE|nr:hypothetical protein I302_08060 [Kwoniella bestiolae CBS 10118]OCF22412.1 hypothetical protein I302_08060 [Kwoniella bestiolae CBS 10118]